MALYKFCVRIGLDGIDKHQVIEIDDDAMLGLTQEGREEYLEQSLEAWANENLTVWWEGVDKEVNDMPVSTLECK